MKIFFVLILLFNFLFSSEECLYKFYLNDGKLFKSIVLDCPVSFNFEQTFTIDNKFCVLYNKPFHIEVFDCYYGVEYV